MIEIINLIIGSILGWYGRDWIENYSKKTWEKKVTQRAKILGSPKVNEWLFKYYQKEFKEGMFYQVEIDNQKKTIPMFVLPKWIQCHNNTESFLQYNRKTSSIPVDKKLIRYRKKLGQNLWNDSMLCLDKIVEQNGKVFVEAKKCDFFQYVSRCGNIEDETIRAIQKNTTKAPLRDQYAKSLEKLKEGSLETNGIGVHTFLALKNGKSYNLLIQKRSDNLLFKGGLKAGVPCLGCTPVEDSIEKDVLSYNVLKEIYEELYDKEEVIKKTKRLVVNWFYQQEPIKSIINLRKENKIEIKVLGFGIEALSGEVNLSVLVIINDEDFIRQEISRMSHNWEMNGVEPIDYKSKTLDKWILKDEVIPPCAYSIIEARKHLNKIKNDG